jgi:hypothetical protein
MPGPPMTSWHPSGRRRRREAGLLWLLILSLPGEWPVRSQPVFGGRTNQSPGPRLALGLPPREAGSRIHGLQHSLQGTLAQVGRHAPSLPARSAGPSTNQAFP